MATATKKPPKKAAKKKTTKKAAPAASKVKKKRTRQKDLPTMEDRKDRVLEELGAKYADARDNRMAYGEEEVDLKQRILKRMHDQKIDKYTSTDVGIEIEIVTEEEKVKVRKHKPPKDDAPDKE